MEEKEKERYKEMKWWKKCRKLGDGESKKKKKKKKRKKKAAHSSVDFGEIWKMVVRFVDDWAESGGCKCSIG